MKEFTFGELKQGLICCTIYRDCEGCPAFSEDDFSCTHQLMAAALNCINVMEKDLASAVKRAEEWKAVATKQELIEL